MSDQIFTMDVLRRATKTPTLWQRIRLMFRPMNHSYDGDCRVYFKELDGVTFIKEFSFKQSSETK